ncbi:MAG: isoleucine--tRNA ligase, partial [Nitrospirota bacterium]
MEKKINYKDTLNLPKTNFPMKADLGRLEPKILDKWEKEEIYRKLQDKTKGHLRYILHDGPPYANGHIHQGHALNKILKDLIIKSKMMEGYNAPYVPGWDCHGLPIEHQVLKDLGSKKEGMGKLEIRRRCREYTDRFVDIQRNEFKRLGVFGDWNNPYLTMTPDYEAAIVREFGKIVATGSVYKGKKPVLWCSFDETALAEAEVEYADHTSPSIYVKFPFQGRQNETLYDIFKNLGQIQDQPLTRQLTGLNLSIVIWTTTPWTLVANRAICLHPSFTYVVCLTGSSAYIIARDLFDRFTKQVLGSVNIQQVGSFTGAKIEGWKFIHPWTDQASPIVLGEHVTLDQGTGCVHTAPGHGQEDYEIGLKYGLEVYAPVDHHGKFTQDAGIFAGQKVFEANKEIIGLLKDRGMLLKEETITHSYPHCWRCKSPVIFRATEQWFISMENNRLRERAINAIRNDIKWIPKWGKDRILGMMEGRPDWCISRQRAWGVPIIAFTCLDCKEVLLSQDIINYVADQMEKTGEGSDIWFSKTADKLLPEGTSCPGCKGNRFQQEEDILDVWFESGVSHAAVLKRRQELKWPADLYLEGSDQHRGWFHSSLLTALLSDGQAPYKAVLTHGFVVDGNGKKMSKSAGNVVAPQEVIN